MSCNEPVSRRIKVQIIFTIPFLLFHYAPLAAQDVHFSQLHTVPLFLNPAYTGSGDEDFRVFNLYRNQWNRIDVPYNTFQFAADVKVNIYGRQFGLGGVIIHDESSSVYLTVNRFHLSISHAFYFQNHRLLIALQPGLAVKNYNADRIRFGSQFDQDSETFDPALPSNENFLSNNLRYFDLNAGVLWQSRIRNLKPGAGIAVSHINRPVESFYTSNDSLRVPLKTALAGNLYIPFLRHYSLDPQVLYTRSGSSSEFVFGMVGSYYPVTAQSSVKRIFLLSHYRVDPLQTLDALILGAGLQVNALEFCVSYDINVSPLRKASRYQGGFEISIVYRGITHSRTSNAEPCIML